jgi:AraC-like DNA-binding protein
MKPSSPGDPITLTAGAYDNALVRFGGIRIESALSVPRGDLLVAMYESPAYDLQLAAMDVPRLSINLASAAVVGGIGTDTRRAYRGRRYSLFYTPAGADARWSKPMQSRHLNIYFRAEFVEELAGGRATLLLPDRPLVDAHLGRLRPWIDALERSIGYDCRSAAEVSTGLANLIVTDLACPPGRCRPTLSTAALARVEDFVAENLGGSIRVADLAAEARLSVDCFSLRFRTATGLSPHRFVLERRVTAAMHLLGYSARPIADVAAECGFSSQQHMATTMRRIAGVAPSEVRRGRNAAVPGPQVDGGVSQTAKAPS